MVRKRFAVVSVLLLTCLLRAHPAAADALRPIRDPHVAQTALNRGPLPPKSLDVDAGARPVQHPTEMPVGTTYGDHRGAPVGASGSVEPVATEYYEGEGEGCSADEIGGGGGGGGLYVAGDDDDDDDDDSNDPTPVLTGNPSSGDDDDDDDDDSTTTSGDDDDDDDDSTRTLSVSPQLQAPKAHKHHAKHHPTSSVTPQELHKTPAQHHEASPFSRLAFLGALAAFPLRRRLKKA